MTPGRGEVDERQPLLAHEQVEQQPSSPPALLERTRHALLEHGPLFKVLIFAILWGTCNYGIAPSMIDLVRSFTCAYQYSQHPELLPQDPNAPLPSDGDKACAVPGVESKVGLMIGIYTTLTQGVASMAMMFYGPKLAIWGRKPLLVLGFASAVVGLSPLLLLPLGYPFGPRPDQLAISPKVSLIIAGIASFLQGLMGDQTLVYTALKVMSVDLSKPETRSLYLTWLLTATLIGCLLGPALSTWAIESSIASQIAHSINASGFVQHPKHPNHNGTGQHPPSPTLTQTPGPIPTSVPVPMPPGGDQPPSVPSIIRHGNTAAVRLFVIVYLISALSALLLLPETNKADENAAPPPKRGLLGPLTVYLPVRGEDGKRDWRLTRLAAVTMLSTIGTTSLQQVMIFGSYAFSWGAEQIGFVLAAIGVSRASVLTLLVPAVTALLARHRPRGPVVDFALARLSFATDALSSAVLFLGAAALNLPTFVSGTMALSLGAAANPALASAAIAIVASIHPNLPSTDAWLSALAVSDGFINFVAPIGYNLLYSLTVESPFPAACFLITFVVYAAAFVLVQTVG